MVAGTEQLNASKTLEQNRDTKLGNDSESAERFHAEAYDWHSSKVLKTAGKDSQDFVEPPHPQAKPAEKTLPPLQIDAATTHKDGVSPRVLPWGEGSNMHMDYPLMKDSILRMGEGPFHVAQRLLGDNALDSDVKALTKAMKDQYLAENQGDPAALDSLRIGHAFITEKNIAEVLDRIPDLQARQRIADKLAVGWTDKEPPHAVPFGGDGRPGETHPDRIDDADQFRKDLAAAAIDVNAAGLRAKGLCAAGARLSLNELPNWHIDGGTVDKSINKDPNGWRSGLQMAKDLAGTGLFDVVPLKKLGYNNLKEGYIVGRYHYPDYVKRHPSWDGEDMGDIDIMTKKHRPPKDNDDSTPVVYHDSFVLIPKKAN